MTKTPNTTIEAVLAKSALFGVAGWAGENALYGSRYSAVFQGHRVPFLPVYAAGGLAVMAAAPHVRDWSTIARAAIYAALGTAVEYAACQLDRKVFSARSWDYGAVDGLADKTDGCINWKHSALWGALGVLAEKVSKVP